MLRKIRIAAAAFFFVLTTLLFLDFTGTLHAWFGWMAKIQFLPALLALNVGVVAFLVILTLLFGRVYCSVICPLGVMQDIVSWASGKRRKHRNRFAYSPALTWLRRGMLVVFVAARALQRLRPHRLEPAGPGLRVGQQPAGIHRRAHGQLRLLFGRRLDEESLHAACCRRDVRRAVCSCVAQRPHLL